jgi:hypothetical protein
MKRLIDITAMSAQGQPVWRASASTPVRKSLELR